MFERWLPRILWIDGLSGLTAGLFVLLLRTVLAEVYAMPLVLVTIMGLANMSYATFALWLAGRKRRTTLLVMVLAVANYAWSAVCVALVLGFARTAHAIGIAHVAFEAAYVSTLATIELRNRSMLMR